MAVRFVPTSALVVEGEFGEWCSFCWQSYALELQQWCDGCDVSLCADCSASHPEVGLQCPTCGSASAEETR